MLYTLTILLTPPAANWLLARCWRRWRALRLHHTVFALWLLALVPVCATLSINLAKYLLQPQPYALALSAPQTPINWQTNGPVGEYPLRASHYIPSLGGINCDSDCTTMASGDKVAWWINGRNGVHAAACPREWGWRHGVRFTIDGTMFECRDTGGWINCYTPGEYDPALKRSADTSYCWVDLLGNWGIPYGTLINNWQRS